MILKMTLPKPINGFWDNGAKSVFEWEIDHRKSTGKEFLIVGSWEANFWFSVKRGKTEKQTLSYAKRYLKHKQPEATFEYINN